MQGFFILPGKDIKEKYPTLILNLCLNYLTFCLVHLNMGWEEWRKESYTYLTIQNYISIHQLQVYQYPFVNNITNKARSCYWKRCNMTLLHCRGGSSWSPASLEFISSCLAVDPAERPSADRLLVGQLFVQDGFSDRFGQVFEFF